MKSPYSNVSDDAWAQAFEDACIQYDTDQPSLDQIEAALELRPCASSPRN